MGWGRDPINIRNTLDQTRVWLGRRMGSERVSERDRLHGPFLMRFYLITLPLLDTRLVT